MYVANVVSLVIYLIDDGKIYFKISRRNKIYFYYAYLIFG